MISFACSHCRQSLTVKDEFAGRTAKCPGCKQQLTVPAMENVPTRAAGGSLAEAGVEGRILLDQTVGTPGQKPVHELLAQRSTTERYQIENQIARGGMGAVMRAVDCDLRREVAVKFMLDQADPKKKQRFVEEAQITGQLEHPNIVPIHELGLDAQKRLFFAMKMVKGRSLAEVLNIHRDEPKKAEKDWPLGRLLGIFVNICHALAYAHSRGVIHRDLKPANVMVGDFGEVYVMDWGLAKVLHGGGQQAETLSLPGENDSAGQDGKVVTDRGPEGNLTQEGSILGTPMYMPPEQAAGQIQAIDQRSDVYSLGAILFEMLTLEPPVDPEGGPMGVLMQVLQGQVIPPEQRTPARAKAGKIPRELSAIAMKALAKEAKDRYASVEDLRKDIERFQEGRSVSAKEDTKWEMIWKFVKRNKGFSAGAAATLLVLLTSVVVLFQAWQDTRAAQAETLKEQAEKEKKQAEKEQLEKEKREQLVRSVPTLVRSARLLADEGDVDEARRQVELALGYDGNNADAHLLKGQLFVSEKKWDPGRAQPAQYLKLRPGDSDAQKLLDLCARGNKADTAFLVEVAEVFQKQKLYGVGSRLLKDVQATVKEREPLLALYRKQIEKAWPGQGKQLSLEPNGRFRLNFEGFKALASLDPLRGIPLNELSIGSCPRIEDLSPLRGMPLASLQIGSCERIRDLGPLEGMPLIWLNADYCPEVRDLGPLKGMRLTYLNISNSNLIQDLEPLRRMPLERLTLPEGSGFRDLEPLRGMPLTYLCLGNIPGPVDLSALDGMKLAEIRLPVSVSKGMKTIRGMKTLTRLNGGPAEEFWTKYDVGEYPQYKP